MKDWAEGSTMGNGGRLEVVGQRTVAVPRHVVYVSRGVLKCCMNR